MQHLQQGIEEAQRSLIGLAVDGLRLSVDVGGLHHFEIPTRELVPEEFIYCHQCFGEAVFREQVNELFVHLLQLGLKPLGGNLAGHGLFALGHLPAFHQTEGIPNLVVEVTTLLAERLVEEDVVAGRSGEHHAHAHAVGAEAVDEIERVG